MGKGEVSMERRRRRRRRLLWQIFHPVARIKDWAVSTFALYLCFVCGSSWFGWVEQLSGFGETWATYRLLHSLQISRFQFLKPKLLIETDDHGILFSACFIPQFASTNTRWRMDQVFSDLNCFKIADCGTSRRFYASTSLSINPLDSSLNRKSRHCMYMRYI